MDYAKQLQAMLDQQFPITRNMGVRVVAVGDGLVFEAPLEPNINHMKTAFGGSIFSLAVLAGWCWVWVQLQQEGLKAEIMIHVSNLEYLKPIHSAFSAEVALSQPQNWVRIRHMLERKGVARLEVEVVVRCEGADAARFQGVYALLS